MPPAIFLDRDDTLIHCDDVAPDGDLGDPALVRLVPGAADACSRLKAAGYRLIVVSNQGGVARGRFTVTDVERVNARLNELLGGAIDAFRFCPYHPRGAVPEFTREHPWRKPQAGMFFDAALALSIDLPRSWTIGDADRDMQAGRAAGTRTIQIVSHEPGDASDDPTMRALALWKGRAASAPHESSDAEFIAVGLRDATDIILRRSGR